MNYDDFGSPAEPPYEVFFEDMLGLSKHIGKICTLVINNERGDLAHGKLLTVGDMVELLYPSSDTIQYVPYGAVLYYAINHNENSQEIPRISRDPSRN